MSPKEPRVLVHYRRHRTTHEGRDAVDLVVNVMMVPNEAAEVGAIASQKWDPLQTSRVTLSTPFNITYRVVG